MTQNEFNDLSDEKIMEGFKLSFENSENLFNAAEELAAKDFTPIAISLVILSAEEALKTLLFLIAKNKKELANEFDVQELFSSHSYKHNTLKDIFDTFIEIQDKVFEKMLSFINEFESENKTIKDWKIPFINSYRQRKATLNSDYISSWWKSANNLKMRGFYLDYKNNNWVIPKTLNRIDYLKCFDIVGSILISLKTIVLLHEINSKK